MILGQGTKPHVLRGQINKYKHTHTHTHTHIYTYITQNKYISNIKEKTVGHISVSLFLGPLFCSIDLCVYLYTDTTALITDPTQ